MKFKPVHRSRFNDPKFFGTYCYAMALLGDKEYPIRVFIERYKDAERQVRVQPTTCNTGESVWISLDLLLEPVDDRTQYST